MNWQFKKIFSIVFAILAGVGIIFFAWRIGNVTEVNNPGNTNDGAWKDTLSVVPQTSSASQAALNTVTSTSPSSVTESAAQKLLDEYASVKGTMSSSTPLSQTDADLVAKNLLNDSASTSTIKQYTTSDIRIIESSTSTVTTYKQEVLAAITTLSKENAFDELLVVNKAIDTSDETKLTALSASAAGYQKFVNTLLATKVPRSAVNLHLYLLQSYATILSGVIDMEKMFSDPLIGLQGIAKYNSGLEMASQTQTLFSPK